MIDTDVRKEVIAVEQLKKSSMVAGQLLFGQYRIEELIGKGGFSRVYCCRHVTLNRKVAIKQIEISALTQSVIQNESEILKILKHSGIPTLYDIQKDEKYYYLVEEFFEGEVLSHFVHKKQLDMDKIGKIMLSLIEICFYLHTCSTPILYLDLQPNNIIIQQEQVALVDFGNARRKGKQREQNYFHGTPGYAAPEQYYGEAEEQSDIYGIGAILYFLLYQKAPGGTKLLESSSYPYAVVEWMRRALRHQKEERFQSMEEVKQTAESLFQSQTSSSKDSSLTITFAGSIRRIGTTHISLAFAEYLGKQGFQVLYQEENPSRAIWHMADAYHLSMDCGIIQFPHFQAFPYYNDMVQKPEELYDVKIKDFGVLTEEKKAEYQDSDGCFLVFGVKPWEQKEITPIYEAKKTILLYNFSSSEEYRYFLKGKKEENCFRVPIFLDFRKPDEAAERLFSKFYQIFWGENIPKGRWCFWKRRTGVHKRPERQ